MSYDLAVIGSGGAAMAAAPPEPMTARS